MLGISCNIQRVVKGLTAPPLHHVRFKRKRKEMCKNGLHFKKLQSQLIYFGGVHRVGNETSVFAMEYSVT